ncbi:response regulator transcription factor [Noviherbaspirillum denitrificans]|uniref:Two-component system response regulator n=1 Tax=Noviherbaspirillum denitrificans TaxID=1968433 RepID=A0A254TFG6_9BURK|nr:response regulator transcription factor [Noviherbaspirillum denitrificans]OWW21354.1 two-component system response regulator [Noviherbaspirillum denitrificans]
MKPKILILDDDDVFSATLARSLERRGLEATVAHTGDDALQAATRTAFDYATIDLHLAEDSGLQWIAPLRAALPHARLLVLTGYASIATTVQAIKLGADDYLAKPVNVDSILSALQFKTGAELALPGAEEMTPLTVDRLEWEHIQRVLAEHQGNISSTARALNMHRRTLQRKLGKKPVGK